MTMANEIGVSDVSGHRSDDISDTITRFLLASCRRRLRPTAECVNALMQHVQLASERIWKTADVCLVPTTTGSVAEFYIEPMVWCIGDLDLMCYFNNLVVLPAGYPPYAELPDGFHDRVGVLDMRSSEWPGYVHMKLTYSLSRCSDDGVYGVLKTESPCIDWFHSVTGEAGRPRHGPAMVVKQKRKEVEIDSEKLSLKHSTDYVPCFRCLVWPPQAAGWPIRQRSHGWPDSPTVDRVVGNGCDVVGVTHRQCRQDEWASQHQWRLSFSRAEIVLLNSCVPQQQITYHILRVYVKSNRLTKLGDSSRENTLSNYHIKTLLLWAFELKPRQWWVHDCNLIKIFVTLLRNLAAWLVGDRLRHYFISDGNLFELKGSSLTLETIAAKLRSVTQKSLCDWFLMHYCKICAQLCPGDIQEMYEDIGTSVKLYDALSTIVDWRTSQELNDSWTCIDGATSYIVKHVSVCSLSARLCLLWLDGLEKVDERFIPYFIGVAFLHFVYKATRAVMDDDLVDALAVLLLRSNARDLKIRCFNHSHTTSSSSMKIARSLMSMVKYTDPATHTSSPYDTSLLVIVEISKMYLSRALRTTCDDDESIYRQTNVYLAVLCYITGLIQTAMDHCTLAVESVRNYHSNLSRVHADILPRIDNKIDNVLGLTALYQYTRTAALLYPQSESQNVVVFTTEAFAHYLLYKTSVSAGIRWDTATHAQEYRICLDEMQHLFITDVLLLKTTVRINSCNVGSDTHNCQCKGVQLPPSETQLVTLLTESAVEYLTDYRVLRKQDFGHAHSMVTEDFKALHAYRCGSYEYCLDLCDDIIDAVASADLLQANLDVCPEFLQLMDDDVASLVALLFMASGVSKIKLYDDLYASRINQLTLTLHLQAHCKLKTVPTVDSVVEILNDIEAVRNGMPGTWTLDHLMLTLLKCKVLNLADELTVDNSRDLDNN